MRASRPSMRPSWRRARPRPRRPARSPAAGRPQPPVEGPLPTDQVNLTDEESRIMPVAGGGFEQCYNAQAAVAAGSLLVVAADVVQAPNDKQQIEPMLGKIADAAGRIGQGRRRCWRTTDISARANVNACAAAGIDPLIAMGRRGASSAAGRTFRRRPAAAGEPHAGRGDGASAARRRRARSSTPCASRRPSRCSASSNRCSGSASSCCVGSTKSAASGAS